MNYFKDIEYFYSASTHSPLASASPLASGTPNPTSDNSSKYINENSLTNNFKNPDTFLLVCYIILSVIFILSFFLKKYNIIHHITKGIIFTFVINYLLHLYELNELSKLEKFIGIAGLTFETIYELVLSFLLL